MSGVTLPPGAPPGVPHSVPPGTPAPARVPGAPGLATGTLVDPSAAFVRLATGTILAGTVIGRDAAGLVAIRTDLGILSLAIDTHLPPDSKVSIEIRVAGSRLHAILLSVEAPPEAAKHSTGPAPPARTAPAVPAEAIPTAGGRIVTALVIQPASLPPPMAGPAPVSAAPAQPVIPPPTGTPPPGSGTAGPAAPFTIGAEISLRIVGIAPPTADSKLPLPAAPVAGSPTPLIAGTVKAMTPAGNPVVQTPQGALVLGIRTPVPVGSGILMEVVTGPPVPAGMTVVPLDSPHARALSQDWSALTETAALLTRPEPGQATIPPLPLPQVGPRLAAGLLNFLAAFGAGDFASWFGAGARERLERAGHGDLVNRARQELGQIAQLATDSASDEWRLLLLPLLDETGLQKARLYLRRRTRDGDPAERDETGTRFILEVELTRLGALQLDGLMQARRFDLMLRSRVPLTAQMQRDITGIFDEARAIGGFAGTMAFATASTFPVIPLDNSRDGTRRGSGVLV